MSEPLTDEEFAEIAEQAEAGWDLFNDDAKHLLATIDADRKRLALAGSRNVLLANALEALLSALLGSRDWSSLRIATDNARAALTAYQSAGDKDA